MTADSNPLTVGDVVTYFAGFAGRTVCVTDTWVTSDGVHGFDGVDENLSGTYWGFNDQIVLIDTVDNQSLSPDSDSTNHQPTTPQEPTMQQFTGTCPACKDKAMAFNPINDTQAECGGCSTIVAIAKVTERKELAG